MKHYGFNPFVVFEKGVDSDVIYDLLFRANYIVPKEFTESFGGDAYKSKEEIKNIIKKDNSELEETIEHGKKSGLLVETKKRYFKKQIVDNFVSSMRFPKNFKKITIQPTGICDLDCDICEKYINCICGKNNAKWKNEEIENFLNEIIENNYNFYELNVIGGDLLANFDLEYLEKRTVGIHVQKISVDIMFNKNTVAELLKTIVFFGINKRVKINLKIPFINPKEFSYIVPAIKEINSTSQSVGISVSIYILFNRIDVNSLETIENLRKNIGPFSIDILVKKDFGNIEDIRLSKPAFLAEKIGFEEYYFRKVCNRCWGFSFSIDSAGLIKPCLWSSKVFSKWGNGRFKSFLLNPATSNFWHSGTIDNNGSSKCKKCALRYCCKYCRVIDEMMPEAYNKICNICI